MHVICSCSDPMLRRLSDYKSEFTQVSWFDEAQKNTDTVVFCGRVTEDVFESFPKLRWVQHIGAWLEPELFELAQERNVAVVKSTGCYAVACAERVLMLLLSATTQTSGATLSGQSVLLLGAGPIGRSVARLVRGLGAHVTIVRQSAAFTPFADRVCLSADGRPESDGPLLIVNALPLSPATRSIIDDQWLAGSRDVFVNVAPSQTIDLDSLEKALTAQRVRWLGVVPVWPPESSPLEIANATAEPVVSNDEEAAALTVGDVIRNLHCHLAEIPIPAYNQSGT